jgi:c-di-GMP-binding flagellar brake protein YcgR
MNQQQMDMLVAAIERNAAAVLALPSAGMLRYHKTRFLRAVDQRIWLEGVPEERLLINSLIETGEPVLVSFKLGQQKAGFSAPILEVDNQYRFFESDNPIQALLMNRPGAIKPQQRRSSFRVQIRPEDGFHVKLWRINDLVDVRDEPSDLCELQASVTDLSSGGVGVAFDSKPLLVTNQRLRVLLSWGKRPPIILEGRCGPVRLDKIRDNYKTGVQFQNLQATLQGRQFLTELNRTISSLQLEEARRNRSARKTA